MSEAEELDTSFTLADSDPEVKTERKFPKEEDGIFQISPPSEEKDFHFRDYQKDIYENAKNRNGIIFLDTGTGKTVISLMLSCYYLYKTRRAKKVAFLANTVQLVRQQYNVISELNNLHKQIKWEFEEYEGNESKIIIKT